MANLNNVTIQSAIAANSARESYDSISNLIDANLKKLDADVFTAHDNPAGDDLTTILNAQKSAADINAREADNRIFLPAEGIVQLGGNSQNNGFTNAIPEINGLKNADSTLGGRDLPTDAVHNGLNISQAAGGDLHEIAQNSASHLAESHDSHYTYNNNGGSGGRDGTGHDGKDGINGMNGTNGTNGTDGTNGKDGTDGHGADCGCGCHDHDHGGHQHHGHDPVPPHHHEPIPPHHHNPFPPHHHEPQPPHHGGGCDEPTHDHDHGHGGGFQLPNLLNIDILGNLGGGFLHGHLGNPAAPLINIVGGGNLLGGHDNNPSDYGRILDVVTNTNMLNHGKDAPILSDIDIGLLRGQHNTPLLEVGLHGDVLHNGGELLDVNLGTQFWGKNGPDLGANVINLKDFPKEKLAALANQIAEKTLNGPSNLANEIDSLLDETKDGPNSAQPLVQVGLALATLGATLLGAPTAPVGGAVNVATGDLNQFANAVHNDLTNLAHMDLGSVLANNPVGADLGAAVSSLPVTLGSVAGVLSGNISNVTGTLANDGGALIGALQSETGGVSGNLGNIGDVLHSDVYSITGAVSTDIGSVAGTAHNDVGSVIGGVGSELNGITSGLHSGVDSLVGAVGNLVGGVTGTVGSELGGILTGVHSGLDNVVGTLTGDVGSVTSGVAGNLGNVIGTLNGDVSGIVGSVGGIVGGVTGSLGNVIGSVTGNLGNIVGTVAGDVGSVTGGVAGNLGSVIGGVTGNLGNGADTVHGDIGSVVGSITGNAGAVGGTLTGIIGGTGSSLTGIVHDTGLSGTGITVNTNTGTIGTSLAGHDLAGVHLGSSGIDITLPVLGGMSNSNSLPEISISNSGLSVGGANSIGHTGLSSLDPLSPFADHGSSLGGISGVDVTHTALHDVIPITHDLTSVDHHIVQPLHGHG